MKEFKNIEFFTSPEGDILIRRENGTIDELTENSIELINVLFDKIRLEYIEAFGALSAYYSKSHRNLSFFKYLCVRRFIRCNMSNFDTLKFDLDNENIFHFEQVLCPMRGECQLQNIVCNPKFNTTLSDREKMICDLYCESDDIQSISDELFLSKHTVSTHIKKIFRKLNIHSKADLIKFRKMHDKI